MLRDSAGLHGVLGLVDLSAASDQDRAADPGAQADWEHSRRLAPPRLGERVTQTRFVIDRDAYQAPSPTVNATPVVTLQRYLALPSLAWDYLTLFEPEAYDQYFALADLPRAAGADFVVGGRRYGLFAHDFRLVPVDTLVELWTECAPRISFRRHRARPRCSCSRASSAATSHDFTRVRSTTRDSGPPSCACPG